MFDLRHLITLWVTTFNALSYAREHRSIIPRSDINRVELHPIGVSGIAELEYRGPNTAPAHNNAHKVEGIQRVVNKEYGLRRIESFYWGQNGNPVANLTAYTEGEEVRVLSMERFNDVLTDAKCSDTSIALIFNEEVEFDLVHEAWDWVNTADQYYIVMVTENTRCNIPDGDPTVRQPWHVVSAQFDDDTNTIVLGARPKSWSEAFSSWRLKLSSKALQSSKQEALGKRDQYSVPLGQDFSGAGFSIDDIGGSDNDAAISCDPCYTSGKIDFDIDISPSLTTGLGGTFGVDANDMGASLTAKTAVSGALSGVTATYEIYKWAPIGVAISGVADIGFLVVVDVAANIGAIEGSMDMSTGVDVIVPNGSKYLYNLDNGNADEYYGWTPNFRPLQPQISSGLSVSASLGTEVRLEVEFSILGSGAAAGLILAAPTLHIEVTAIEEDNACDVSGADTGVELEVGLGGSLKAFEEANLLELGTTAYRTIVSTSLNLYSTCMTVTSELSSPSESAASNSLSVMTTPSGDYSGQSTATVAPPGVSSNSLLNYSSSYSGDLFASTSYLATNLPLSIAVAGSTSSMLSQEGQSGSSYLGSATPSSNSIGYPSSYPATVTNSVAPAIELLREGLSIFQRLPSVA